MSRRRKVLELMSNGGLYYAKEVAEWTNQRWCNEPIYVTLGQCVELGLVRMSKEISISNGLMPRTLYGITDQGRKWLQLKSNR